MYKIREDRQHDQGGIQKSCYMDTKYTYKKWEKKSNYIIDFFDNHIHYGKFLRKRIYNNLYFHF